jgi:hypothetical protein
MGNHGNFLAAGLLVPRLLFFAHCPGGQETIGQGLPDIDVPFIYYHVFALGQPDAPGFVVY